MNRFFAVLMPVLLLGVVGPAWGSEIEMEGKLGDYIEILETRMDPNHAKKMNLKIRLKKAWDLPFACLKATFLDDKGVEIDNSLECIEGRKTAGAVKILEIWGKPHETVKTILYQD